MSPGLKLEERCISQELLYENCLLPEFAKIIDIVYDVDHCLFVCHPFVTNCFVSHFHSFEVADSVQTGVKFIKQTDLADHHTLGVYSLLSYLHSKFVSLKYHIVENV